MDFHSEEVRLGVDLMRAKRDRELAIDRQKRDADRYRALKAILEFNLGGYKSATGGLDEATHSSWFLRSECVFSVQSGKEPESIDAAIDEWMKRNA